MIKAQIHQEPGDDEKSNCKIQSACDFVEKLKCVDEGLAENSDEVMKAASRNVCRKTSEAR